MNPEVQAEKAETNVFLVATFSAILASVESNGIFWSHIQVNIRDPPISAVEGSVQCLSSAFPLVVLSLSARLRPHFLPWTLSRSHPVSVPSQMLLCQPWRPCPVCCFACPIAAQLCH